VFRTIGDPPSSWESSLPPELLRLPQELARVDALLDDPVFFAPFALYFHPVLGRPSTPVECYLRLMFLKFRYRLGYESLCAEVSDSISWRWFCRIGLDAKVPHPTTLMKLTTRCGEVAVAGLNEALLAKAAGHKLLRTARVRADTTVIGANGAYPADCGLLAKAVSLHDLTPGRSARDAPAVLPGFRYKAQVSDNDDGIVLDYAVECGAVPDGPQLLPAIKRIARRTGQVPRAVTADRGYGQAAVERDLHELGVRTVAIPRRARPSPARKTIEHARGFRRLVKWRTGCEGRISYLKRGYGWDRTLLDGKNGAAIWCGHGVFAHNLVKISALAG
jgi:IS5 family transposase